MSAYPEKYVEGIRLFNEEEFFECHEVLEELWQETLGREKKFYQGLIQAAVALFHFGNENLGAPGSFTKRCARSSIRTAPLFRVLMSISSWRR